MEALRAQLQALRAQLQASKGQLTALQARLAEEQANRPAAALKSMCSGIDVDEVAAIVQRAGVDLKDITPYPPDADCDDADFATSVFGIQHVRDTAGKVLAASSQTPAGILRSVLLKVAKPEAELNSLLLTHVMAYIHQEAERCEWTPRQRAHLGGANALAATLSNKTIKTWRKQAGELTLECMQVWPIVRQALATVFQELHGYAELRCQVGSTHRPHCCCCCCATVSDVPLKSAMVALIHKKPEKKGQPKYNVANNEHVCGGELLAKPDIAVVRSSLVLALGETKLRPADDGYVR